MNASLRTHTRTFQAVCTRYPSHSQCEISSHYWLQSTVLVRDRSVPCIPYFSRRNRSIPFRILVTTLWKEYWSLGPILIPCSHKQQHVTTTFVIIRAAPMGMTLWHVKGSAAGLVAIWACIVRTSACIACNLSTTVLWSGVVSCSEPQHTGCAIDLPNGKNATNNSLSTNLLILSLWSLLLSIVLFSTVVLSNWNRASFPYTFAISPYISSRAWQNGDVTRRPDQCAVPRNGGAAWWAAHYWAGARVCGVWNLFWHEFCW